MELAKVVGQVVATVRDPGLPNTSLLLVEMLDRHGEGVGQCHVAIDPIGAGEGEVVLLVRGSSARQTIDRSAPVDLTIVGIVDQVTAGADTVYRKN